MIRFFAPDIAVNPILPEGESAHCVKVLRMQPGDAVEVIDGKGSVYSCRLQQAHHKHAIVEVLSVRPEPLPWSYNLTVAVAPTKHNDRMEWLTEKLTEVGVNRIIPMLCARSERKEIKTERLEKTALSAMKQSLKAVLPQVDEMTPFKQIVEQPFQPATNRFICYCDDAIERRDMVNLITPGSDTIILIGPEGDFSPEEVQLALSHGFIPVTLGQNRLRTETAALYAASAIHIINSLINSRLIPINPDKS